MQLNQQRTTRNHAANSHGRLIEQAFQKAESSSGDNAIRGRTFARTARVLGGPLDSRSAARRERTRRRQRLRRHVWLHDTRRFYGRSHAARQSPVTTLLVKPLKSMSSAVRGVARRRSRRCVHPLADHRACRDPAGGRPPTSRWARASHTRCRCLSGLLEIV